MFRIILTLIFTAHRSDHFPFAKAGVPSISLKEGNEYVGHPQNWGEEQFKAYNTAHYHQPSDEMRDSWDFHGMFKKLRLRWRLGDASPTCLRSRDSI